MSNDGTLQIINDKIKKYRRNKMKKLLSLLLTLTMLLSLAVVGANAYDNGEEDESLISATLTSKDIPYSEEFSAAKTGEYFVYGMSSAAFSGYITLDGNEVMSFQSEEVYEGLYLVQESAEFLEGSVYTFNVDSFDGKIDDIIVIDVSETFESDLEVLEEFVSTDEIPFSKDFETSESEKYMIDIYSPVNVSGRILDENGSVVYEYETNLGEDYYCVSDVITLSPGSEYTFTIDESDGVSEDTVDVFISGLYPDEKDLYYDVLKYSDLPLDAVMIPDSTGKYIVSIDSPVDFSASIVNSSGEVVAEFKAEYDEVQYDITETVVLNEGEEYHLKLDVTETFNGLIGVNVYQREVDPDAILDEEIKGSDVPTSFTFSSETDDFYVVSFMADDMFDWSIADQDGNVLVSKKYDPYSVGMMGYYSAIIKAEAGVEYNLYIDSYEGSDKDDIYLSITKIELNDEEEFPVSTLITGDSIPYSVEFTAPKDGIYGAAISALAEFSASIKDKDGNVVVALDPALETTYDYIAVDYAYLDEGETYYLSIDSYSGKPTDVLTIDIDSIDSIIDIEDGILNEMFLYSDLDNGPKTFEMTANESCDYSLVIMSVSSVKYKVTDEDGNILMEAETESGDLEMAEDFAAFEAGKKYYLTLEGYSDCDNGPVVAAVFKSDEFDFAVMDISYYDEGERFDDTADILLAYHGTDKDVYVPLDMAEIGAIGQYAFENKNIESVMLEEGYEAIYNYAFLNCKELTEVYLPDTLSIINYGAFMGCDNLKSIEIGSDIFIIEPYALGYDSNMNKIEDFVIYGYSGTAAEQYALDNGFEFVDVEEEPTDEPTDEPTEKSATIQKPTEDNSIESSNTASTIEKVKSPSSTTKTTGTKSVNNSQSTNTNTGTKSYVLVIFIVVLAAIAAVIVIKVVKIKKQK